MKIVECIPNYSEGRDMEKIEKITSVFENREGVRLVDVDADENYNRTVVTVIGDPQKVKEAIVDSVGVALELIDLNHHTGEHKRMGAVDVIPFVPINEMSIEEAVTLSEECGEEIATKYNYPVFLYNLSAKKANREKLPTIRKGEFEGMPEKLKDPEWAPDFGKAEIHPTGGVVAVGCRPALIAYNIDCATKDKSACAFIAKSIRLSGGGYKCIQAGPAEMEDFVQVTMNVTDYTQTSVYRAFEATKMEAKRFDIEITGSEFIGLVPRNCLEDIAAYYKKERTTDAFKNMSLRELIDIVTEHLLLRDFTEEKVIEYYLQ